MMTDLDLDNVVLLLLGKNFGFSGSLAILKAFLYAKYNYFSFLLVIKKKKFCIISKQKINTQIQASFYAKPKMNKLNQQR